MRLHCWIARSVRFAGRVFWSGVCEFRRRRHSHTMTKYQRIIFAGVVLCALSGGMIAALWSQPASHPDFELPIEWIIVNADASTRDAKILDAVVCDVLTNRALAPTCKGYGLVNKGAVRYTGFPASYKPKVPGYRFDSLPSSNNGSGLKFTLLLAGIWVDQPLPKNAMDDFRLLRLPYPAERGVLLSIYDSGGPTTNGNHITTTIGAPG